MKFVGRWLDREGVVHADNPYKRKGFVYGYLDPQASVTQNFYEKKTHLDRTLERHPCGRGSMAVFRYLPRSTVVTCLTCLVATFEAPTASSTRSTSRRRRSR